MQLKTFFYILIAALVIGALLFFRIGGKSALEKRNIKGDTTLMYVLFINDFSGNLRGGVAKRVIKDSLKLDEKQSIAIWRKDTVYYIGTPDSALDNKGKKVNIMAYKYYLPSKYVSPTAIVLQ